MNLAIKILFALLVSFPVLGLCGDAESDVTRVFIFAGQSNMVGTHSRVVDINRFPPFEGLDQPQRNILFAYKMGREEMITSDGWVSLQPTTDYFGPELSFGRIVSQNVESPIAIIKCASGGTSLGKDWNPDMPDGFKLYPLALELVRSSLAELDRKQIKYRLEGFMWHQGENDMFDKDFKPAYGKNLEKFIASWRRDLKAPQLKFYIGELCTKTIWGMDNRDNMYAIRTGQKSVADTDPLVQYVPTSHDAVEIGGGEGLHYHYGTLGQLEHGANYAEAYLRSLGKVVSRERRLEAWPYSPSSKVKLFILAGHRNMEGERAFTQQLKDLSGYESLAKEKSRIAFRYHLGGGFRKSNRWEPLGPAGPYDTFGPELSFAESLQKNNESNIAIAKFTHSGSQINDWTPEGTRAKDLNLYSDFITFIREAIQDLEDRGHSVEVAGVFYHVGENDMAFYPYRKDAAKWLRSTIVKSREDLLLPDLRWYISQQLPPDEEGLNRADVTAELARLQKEVQGIVHIRAFDLPPQKEKLVFDSAGVVMLGELLARGYLDRP
ncbi:MAG: hypothetical protein RLY14_1451 [Planctomycetota bacterium]